MKIPPSPILYEPGELRDHYPEAKQLKILCDILDKYCQRYNKSKYWIDWGTLLGAYREGKIIDWDYDIDLGLLLDFNDILWNYRQVYLLQMLQESFFIQYFVPDSCISLLPHDFENFHLNQIDITFYNITDKVCQDIHKNKTFRSFFVDEMELVKMYDFEFFCPRHTSDFLTLRYGNGWKIPDKSCSPTGNLSTLKESYNVYTCMVADMFHIGHLNVLKRCEEQFNKVIVGIHNDADVMTYKNKPVIPYEQRLEIVRSCKYVDEILENAPPITTNEFLDSIGADFIVAGRESHEKIQKLYPVDERRLHLIRRTENISSSEIKEIVKSV